MRILSELKRKYRFRERGKTVENKRPNKEEMLVIDRDAQIKVVVNNADGINEDAIIMGSVFHNMKDRFCVFAWVILICILMGLLSPLLLYQFRNEPTTVSSVVTLNNAVNQDELNSVKSVPVIRKSLINTGLYDMISLEDVAGNLSIEEIDSTTAGKKGYLVFLSNGFSSAKQAENGKKIYLSDEELQSLLDHLLYAGNDLLIKEHDIILPNNDMENVANILEKAETWESVRIISNAMSNLYDYCMQQPENVQAYRSWKDGRSLKDWISILRLFQEYSIDSFDFYINASGVAKDPVTEISSRQYELQQLQSELLFLDERMSSNQTALDNYKAEDVYLFSQENGITTVPGGASDEYNEMLCQQVKLLAEVVKLKTEIACIQNSITAIGRETKSEIIDSGMAERTDLIRAAEKIYNGIYEHMTEVSSYMDEKDIILHSYPEGGSGSIIANSAKKMIVGTLAGAFIACFAWFIAGLIPEFRKEKKYSGGEETTEALADKEEDQ